MAEQTDVQRLLVSLEANANKFAKELEKANGVANRRAKQIETRFQRMNRHLSASFARLGPALGIGLGAIGIGKIVSEAKEAVAEFDKLAKTARTVGLSTDTFQAIEFAAIEEGVEGVESALIAFTKRTGEAAQGTGALTTFLKKYDETLLANIRTAATQEERLRLVANAIANAGDEADKAALAAAAFGRSGVEMVRILKDGAVGLDDFTRRARDLGVVIDRQLLEKSEDLNNQLGVMEKIVDVNLKQAFVELVPIIIATANAIATTAREINRLVDTTRGLDDRQSQFLRDRVSAIDERLDQFQRGGLRQSVAEALGRIDDLKRERDEIIAELRARAIDQLKSELTTSPDKLKLPEVDDDTGNFRKSAEDAFERQVAAIRERTAALQLENDVLGLSTEAAEKARIQFELLNAAKQAGLEITPELTAQVEELASAYGAAASTLEASREAMDALADQEQALIDLQEELGDALQSALRGVIQDLLDGRDASEALATALGRVADRLIDIAVSNLFGALLGGAGGGGLLAGVFHSGGVVGEASAGRVVPAAAFAGAPRMHSGGVAGFGPNEVPTILERGEIVIPKLAARQMQQGGGPAPNVYAPITVVTPDAPSFLRSQSQIAAKAAASLKRSFRTE